MLIPLWYKCNPYILQGLPDTDQSHPAKPRPQGSHLVVVRGAVRCEGRPAIAVAQLNLTATCFILFDCWWALSFFVPRVSGNLSAAIVLHSGESDVVAWGLHPIVGGQARAMTDMRQIIFIECNTISTSTTPSMPIARAGACEWKARTRQFFAAWMLWSVLFCSWLWSVTLPSRWSSVE